LSAGGDDDGANFGSRPCYYDNMDDSAQMPVPSVACGFVKAEPSSSSTAVYNNVVVVVVVSMDLNWGGLRPYGKD